MPIRQTHLFTPALTQRILDSNIMETKTVSWIPFAGWVVPDESQHMRIRVKLAVIDVRTGGWTVRAPEPSEDKSRSTSFTRGSSDQKQVEALKRKAYAASALELAKLN